MKAYCVKCKEKQEIVSPVPEFTSTGTPATRGICSVCGTGVYRMGKTESHQGMTPPENTKRKSKKEKPRKVRLVIVESPAKARTIGRYLGKDYKVVFEFSGSNRGFDKVRKIISFEAVPASMYWRVWQELE